MPDGTKAIRYALAGLKGVGEQAMISVVAERAKNGPFKDLYDFARRLDSKTINKRQMELAAKIANNKLDPKERFELLVLKMTNPDPKKRGNATELREEAEAIYQAMK